MVTSSRIAEADAHADLSLHVPAAQPAPRSTWTGPYLTLILLLAAGLRIALLMPGFARLDGDEAVMGIVAQHIARGQPLLYFGGDGYMGAGEQYLQAPIVAFAPADPFLLRLPLVGLAVLTCFLIYRAAIRCLQDAGMALFAAACSALGPWFSLVYGSKPRGYSGTLAVATLGFLVAVTPAQDAAGARRRAMVFGFCCGLGFWLNWASALVLLPAGLWVLGTIRDRPGLILRAGTAFLLGSTAFWIELLRGRLPVATADPQPPTTLAERADGLMDPILEMFLGLAHAPPAGTGEPVAGWLPPQLVLATLMAALGAAAWSRRRRLLSILLLRPQQLHPFDLVLLVFLSAPLLYIASSYSWQTVEPRYLFPLYGLLPVALAGLTARLSPKGGYRRGLLAVAMLCVVAGLTATSFVRALSLDGGPGSGAPPVPSEQLGGVADALVAEGYRAAWADYWVAYPLQYYAVDRLAVSSFYSRHFPATEQLVRDDSGPAYVARHGSRAEELRVAVERAGSSYRERRVGDFILLLDVTPALQPTIAALSPLDTGLTPVRQPAR